MAPAVLCPSTLSLSPHHTFILLCHLLMFISSYTIALSAAQSINVSEIDRQALLSFQSGITNDPLGVLRSWRNDSLDFCSWRGVTCGMVLPPRVVSLDLNSAQLSGELSPSIANLTSLARMDIGNNQVYGTIPEELGTLRHLQFLMLASNKLEGAIPGSLGARSLGYVNLAYNFLNGSIPHSLATSSSLRVLNLTSNSFSGTIPTNLFNGSSELVVVDLGHNVFSGPIPDFHKMSALQILNLAFNSLSGRIPRSLGNVSSLTHILLSTNNLAGSIPESLSNIQNLSVLNLGNNNLSGYVSSKLATSSSLRRLNLASNSLSGIIPTNLFNGSSELVVVDLGNNSFSGPIPDFYKMSALQILNLESNDLSGSIPPSLGNVSSLTYIFLSSNNLSGSIPESLSNIQNLSVLSLGNNNLSGYFSAKLCNISSLEIFDLRQNSLVGPIPSSIGNSLPNLAMLFMSDNFLEAQDWAFLTSLTKCNQLQILAMDGNNLNGSLPRSVGNLSTSLQRISLGRNQIVGTIPVEIGNLRKLQMLAMDQNFLSGVIPSVIGSLSQLIVLTLSGNRLSGQIPSTIGNLSLLIKLQLDNNKLSGNIHASLGNCKQLAMLNLSMNSFHGSIPSQLLNATSLSLALDLSNNNLTGSIPPQIGALINLIRLDISFNNLSGEIPSSLGQCVVLTSLSLKRNMLNGSIPQSFSNLKSIEQIDLSQNNFVGQIPEFFGNFSLTQLDLSKNYFEGPIPTGGIFQNTSAVTLDGNIRLCASATTFIFEFPMCPTTSAVKIKKNARLFLIVIPPITIALFSFLSCMVTLLKKRQAQTTPCYKETMKKVSYGDILKATNWFSPVNKISSSRTGSVYIGRFEFDTDLVAIKFFHLDERGAHNSFLTECEVLRNTRHRNLVKAVTLCSTVDLENNEFKAIVFEFMANGSLDMWVHPKLHQNSPKRGLSLGQRIRIAMDVASALDYMHNQLTPPLIHCDLKPSNVLLDYDMTARVGDFGSAKFLSSCPDGLVAVGGTIGYIAPEYGMGYKISTGCDVYSFGVLLLEMLTGKRPTDEMFTDGLSLHKLVCSAFPDRLQEVIDPHMPHEEHHACATVLMQNYVMPLVEVGLLCSMESPKDRPGMGDVCAEIFAIKNAFPESW